MHVGPATTAETGMIPPPSALPRMYTSGTTPSWSQANVLPGAAEAGLDLVGDHQDVALGAQPADLGEEAVGRDDHAALALDRLEQDGDRVVVDRRRERLGVAVRHA